MAKTRGSPDRAKRLTELCVECAEDKEDLAREIIARAESLVETDGITLRDLRAWRNLAVLRDTRNLSVLLWLVETFPFQTRDWKLHEWSATRFLFVSLNPSRLSGFLDPESAKERLYALLDRAAPSWDNMDAKLWAKASAQDEARWASRQPLEVFAPACRVAVAHHFALEDRSVKFSDTEDLDRVAEMVRRLLLSLPVEEFAADDLLREMATRPDEATAVTMQWALQATSFPASGEDAEGRRSRRRWILDRVAPRLFQNGLDASEVVKATSELLNAFPHECSIGAKPPPPDEISAVLRAATELGVLHRLDAFFESKPWHVLRWWRDHGLVSPQDMALRACCASDGRGDCECVAVALVGEILGMEGFIRSSSNPKTAEAVLAYLTRPGPHDADALPVRTTLALKKLVGLWKRGALDELIERGGKGGLSATLTKSAARK